MGPSRSRSSRAPLLGAFVWALLSCGTSSSTPGTDAGGSDVPSSSDRPAATDVRVWPVPPSAPRVTLETYPRVDGSTSTHPLARVIACELLGLGYRWEDGLGEEGEAGIIPVAPTPDLEPLARAVTTRIAHSRTHQAYLNLIEGSTDLILVANPPSAEERAAATQRGVSLVERPIALDALVIVAHATNPVSTITPDQIRGIFSGTITDWSALGGTGAIHPFVRPENSGSQQLMNAIVMGTTPMANWPADRRPAFMGALLDEIMGDRLAIGYSVFYFVTYQYVSAGYRVLAVNGVSPNASSIGARRYPFTAPVISVVRADLPPSSLAYQLRDWLLTPDGQRTVARSGYVPISP